MDIDKIVKEYPKAFHDWLRSLNITGHALDRVEFNHEDKEIILRLHYGKNGGYIPVHYRRLFDYFDSVGIIIGITPVSIDKDTKFVTGTRDGDFEFWADNRTEAEYEAFERAFEIREKQIEQKT